MFVDSHAHLTSDALFEDIEGIISRAKLAGISHIVNICTDAITLERGLEIHKQFPFVLNAASTTPHDVDTLGEKEFALMEQAAKKGSLVAVGETGLDYHYTHSQKENQQSYLIRYCKLAKACHLPLIIHCREAFSDLFTILDAEDMKNVLIHCFTGNLEEAKEVIKRGWSLSLSGIVTFKKSIELKEVAKWIPIDHLLIETDAPYLSPLSRRGKLNEPSFLPETASNIAELKGISLEEIGLLTTKNTLKFFNLR